MAEIGTRIATPALVEVATAGTAVQVKTSGAEFAAKAVVIQALSTNTSPIVIGDKNVKAKAGVQGTAEQRGIELAAKASITLNIGDATEVWVDVRTNKDGFTTLFLLA